MFKTKKEMLLNDFYTIKSQKNKDFVSESSIILNTKHPIYKGHFPKQPIVPGVCMLQIVTELLNKALKQEKTLKLKTAKQTKFLRVIIPKESTYLTVIINYNSIKENSIKVSAIIKNEKHIFFKFKGNFS